MSTLVFFPWFGVDDEISIGKFALIPFKRSELPGGTGSELQKTLDAALQHYFLNIQGPISEATLISTCNKELLQDLRDEEINSIFAFSELFAFCNLSNRKFFLMSGLEYCNRDLFRLVVHNFEDINTGCKLTQRRRDGITKQIYLKGAYQVLAPKHIFKPLKIQFNKELLKSLLNAQNDLHHEKWSSIYEAIVNFNFANTDSNEVSEEIEVVLAISAFERLLGTSGNEYKLADLLTRTLKPENNISPANIERFKNPQVSQRFRNSNCIRNLWIRDFFRLRGNLAHGKINHHYPSLWSLKDHLLLSSYIFPLLLKSHLSEHQLYSLNDDDQFYINLFELLACEEHCIPWKDNGIEPIEHPWQRIMSEAWSDRIFK